MTRTHLHFPLACAVAALAALLAACNDGGDSRPKTGAAKTGAATGISIDGGGWSGVLYATDQAGRTSIKASISQTGDSVIITTSRPSGTLAHSFTGSINREGKMRITDGFDGEVWSTYFGYATSTYIKLADFEHPPKAGEKNDDFYVIELSRKGGARPASVQSTSPNSTNDPNPPPTLPTIPTPPTPPTPPIPPTLPTPGTSTP